MEYIIIILWCALWNRLRGGPFGAIVRWIGLPDPGTTVTRAFFGIAYAAAAVLLTGNPWLWLTAAMGAALAYAVQA